MKIGIVDSDLVGRSRHRFPNLACMKISGYHKEKGDDVELITNYDPLRSLTRYEAKAIKEKYDKIYVSKVFVDTPIPCEFLNMDNVTYGGSGFFFSDADPLLYEIEHHMPDYHLYDEWIKQEKEKGVADREFNYYEYYSLGFTTRGCVRKCKFCINKHCNKVERASSVNEFYDESKRWICLLDDNVLAYENWKEVLDELNATGKQFEFKQGLDIRSLNEEKAIALVNSNLYINSIYFAFDNIKDKDIIIEKLTLWRKHYKKHSSMYVLCGFDEENKYDESFWSRDIQNTLERIKICMEYNIFPYIMRYRMYKNAPSPYYGMYVNLASWCNQKGTIVKYSLTEWGNAMQVNDENLHNKKRLYSIKRYLMEYAGKYPDVAYEYFDIKYENISKYKYEKNNKNLDKTNEEKSIQEKEVKPQIINLIKKVRKNSKIANNDYNMLESFSHCLKATDNSKVVKFNSLGIKRILQGKSKTLLINLKEENLSDCEKALLLLSKRLLDNTGNLFVINKDLKSFDLTKNFIEQNTELKFKEAVKYTINTGVEYCSRYTIKLTHTNIFNVEEEINRTSMFKTIVENTSKKDDVLISFFESYFFIQNIGEPYNQRNWIHFIKKRKADMDKALIYINSILENKEQQLDLDIEKQVN